jgi:hypothetical protein
LLDENGFDPRIATETLQAFRRIAVAKNALGENATYREIIKKAQCSMSTLSKYNKQLLKNPLLHLATDATDATPKKPNPNPNPISPTVTAKPSFLGVDRIVQGEKPQNYTELKSWLQEELGKPSVVKGSMTKARNPAAFLTRAYCAMRGLSPPTPDEMRLLCGRLGAMVRLVSGDYVLVLNQIWKLGAISVDGEPLNYLEGMLKKYKGEKNGEPKPDAKEGLAGWTNIGSGFGGDEKGDS